jgi:hypothetical protein
MPAAISWRLVPLAALVIMARLPLVEVKLPPVV